MQSQFCHSGILPGATSTPLYLDYVGMDTREAPAPLASIRSQHNDPAIAWRADPLGLEQLVQRPYCRA